MALRPVQRFFIALLAGGVAACGGSGSPGGATPASPRGETPTVVPSTTAAGTTASCPEGADPNTPGPAQQARPQFGEEDTIASAAFDRQSGRVVYVDSRGGTWTFDVCTNTWEQVTTPGQGPPESTDLFYDAYNDLTYALDESLPTILTYDVGTSTWTPVPARARGADHYVMDPNSRVVYGYDPGEELWAYDITSSTWTEVNQGAVRPPKFYWGALTAFDRSVGRIVLYGLRSTESMTDAPAEPNPTGPIAETWTFDVGTGIWAKVSTSTPVFGFGWFARGTEMTYNEASRRTVLVGNGDMAIYDATAKLWTVPKPGPGQPDMSRLGQGLVDDVVNGRVLVIGGSVRAPDPDRPWQDTTAVWAYDVLTNRWTELVPPLPN